jgi:hypothetical protein
MTTKDKPNKLPGKPTQPPGKKSWEPDIRKSPQPNQPRLEPPEPWPKKP